MVGEEIARATIKLKNGLEFVIENGAIIGTTEEGFLETNGDRLLTLRIEGDVIGFRESDSVKWKWAGFKDDDMYTWIDIALSKGAVK